ncbi:hypothetical protein [Kutzneria sp. NPDC052558]|uniref:hypothetical protein n=1 Tax=Kutzneria sp. NPDC052558 TaxID=3364121 RepID=UPI0037CB15E9
MKHLDPDWDMHNELGLPEFSLPRGEIAWAEVICHHAFGLGLYLPDFDAYAHVNIPEVADTVVHGPAEFPAIGSRVRARSFGPSGRPGRPLAMSLRGVAQEE